jgi:hypothetical protein
MKAISRKSSKKEIFIKSKLSGMKMPLKEEIASNGNSLIFIFIEEKQNIKYRQKKLTKCKTNIYKMAID